MGRASLALAVAIAVSSVVLAAPARVAAQHQVVLLDLEGDFVTPVSAPAVDRFLPGVGISAAALFAPDRFLLPVIRGRAVLLGDGAPPADATRADPGVGGLFSLTGGLRLRVDGVTQEHDEPEATGFWAEIDMGVGLTGSLARPVFELGLGFLWDAGLTEAGHLDVGPVARLVHVLQTDERGIDPSSTFLIELGLQFVLFDVAAPAAVEDAIRTRGPDATRREEGVDSDHDGLDDLDDSCRFEPEDLDGFRDLDGCPDTDDDGDNVPDATDECPRDAEDTDGFEDLDGCPDLDDDGDGVVDRDDECGDSVEDVDGWQDTDGCADPDNDGDRVPDGADQCPNDPEVENGVTDEDGCPDEGLVQLVGDRMVIAESTLFAPSGSRLIPGARATLEALAALLSQHPDWTEVHVEGHTAAAGDERWNVALSRRRATAVRDRLVELGIGADRLVVDALGSSVPRVAGTSAQAAEANRRIEIFVVARSAGGGAP
ncbi:MAG: OmpA family protein [Sandaracinus sp.]